MPLRKRILDISSSLFLIVFLSPIFLVVAIVIRLSLGSPILFKQIRPGLHAKPFTLFKFRTLTNAEADGKLLNDAQRITEVGKFLRAYSLDELPQLFNILRGDLSLVGPRPLLMEYLPLYSPEQKRRHQVVPGITGWAQIHGRNDISWEKKFQYDLWYIDNWSLMLDVKILFKTVSVIFRSGNCGNEFKPVTPFKGNSKTDLT